MMNSFDWVADMKATDDIIQFSVERLNADRETVTSVANEVMLCAQEAKLVKYFARILFLKSRNHRLHTNPCSSDYLSSSKYGSVRSWLDVVNVGGKDSATLRSCLGDETLDQLIECSEEQLGRLCNRAGIVGENRRRFLTATLNLQRYTRRWLESDELMEPNDQFLDAELAWIGYNRICRRSASESGIDSGASDSGVGSNVSQTSLPTTTPPPSPGMLLVIPNLAPNKTLLSDHCNRPVVVVKMNRSVEKQSTIDVNAANFRSQSHESNLRNRLRTEAEQSVHDVQLNDVASTLTQLAGRHHQRAISCSGFAPKSPTTGRIMHSIPHVWHKRTALRHLADSCHVCQKPLGVFSEKCKSCKLVPDEGTAQ